ncbi:MAG TPA: ATP-binding protein [Gemmatimonadaceae bacterium]|jgi:signal transduction histidine kinase|nr:ATP-binding protein [Gemmatimonadaceae bacterium]
MSTLPEGAMLDEFAGRRPGAAARPDDDELQRASGASTADAPRVLVVDDTEGNRYAVARLLRGAGMEVSEAATGSDALRLAKELPDLVVLDIKLPDMTGYEVCRQIKSAPTTASIPVMHLSASYTENADRAYGLEAGADAYLTHPVDPALLLATARALMRAGRAEAGFRRAAREWRITFDAIRDPIFLIDGEGVLRRCNLAAAQLAYREPKDLVGEPWERVLAGLGLEQNEALRSLAQVEQSLRDVEVAVDDRCFNISTERTVGISATDTLNVCVWSDVTARVAADHERNELLQRTELALRDAESARREAESANRSKSEFLAVMSHELRTPLNAIAGFTELLSLGIRGPVTEEQLGDLEKIRRSQVTLMGLINDLLSFAKLESGSVHYEVSDIAADEALTIAGEFVELQLRTKGIRFIHVPCDASVILRGDPEKVQQILLNLLSNAMKFTDRGGSVTVSCEREGSVVHIHVTDTGPGIPEDKIEKIFDPFVQVDQRFTREHRGVGLGLAISRELAVGMGGALSVRSVVGEGTTLTLTLPAKE